MNSRTSNHPSMRRRLGLRAGFVLALLLWGASVAQSAGQEAVAPNSNGLFRLGFSTTVFTDVNENDIKGALRVWTETMARELKIPTDPTPLVLDGAVALDAALRSGRVECATMNSLEYLAMGSDLQTGTLIVPVYGGRTTEEYLLLVHRDSPVRQVKDLSGRSLVQLDNPRAALAPIWLDLLLTQAGLRPGEASFSAVTRTPKASQAVHQVFFRKTDACVVTRASFETACELNPQVEKQLRVVAASPALVPQVACYRPDYPAEMRRKVIADTLKVHESLQGRQVLTVFKVDRLEEASLVCLDSARELLATHRRLCGETNSAQAGGLVFLPGEDMRIGQR